MDKKKGLVANIIKIILFLGVLSYLCIHITYVLRWNTDEKRNLMGFYAEEKNSLDVVFIGSSSLWTSINPLTIYEKEGITSYVIATSAQRPSSLIYLLKEAQKTQEEAIFVLDISTLKYDEKVWSEQNEGSLRRVTDGLKYSLNRFMCNWEQTQGREDRISYFFDIIKYHGEWDKFWKNISHWNFELENEEKGYLYRDSFEIVENTWKEGEKTPISQEAELILRELLDYCKNEELNVEFSLAFSTGNTYGTSKYLQEIINEYGFELFIFNEYAEEVGLEYSMDFLNAGHTNVSGAEKASSCIGAYLTEKYALQDKRTDETFCKWNMLAIKNREKVEAGIEKLEKEHEYYIGPMQVEIMLVDDNIVLTNNTISVKELSYAWYVYEKNDGVYERVHTEWYGEDNMFMYSLDKEKEYQFTAFVRIPEYTEGMKYEIVALVYFDKNIDEWVFLEK